MSDIQPSDIELLLTRELNLKETTPTTLEALLALALALTGYQDLQGYEGRSRDRE